MHRFAQRNLSDRVPPPSHARASCRLPPRPPRSYCRQSRQSPHSAPPPSLPRFFPRKPARTPNSFPQFRFPSPASLLLHRQSKRRAARDASRATPRAASATLPPLSRPAIHRSSYRNTSQNPMLPPRGAPDEANRPFPVSAKRTISGRSRRRQPPALHRRQMLPHRVDLIDACPASHQRLVPMLHVLQGLLRIERQFHQR